MIKREYILEIVKQKSFSKAAEALYIAQPSLSRYVRNLEKKLNVKLFDRSKNPISLTLEGELVLDYINESIELEENLLKKLDELKSNKFSEIRIGIVPWRIPVFLPKVIPEFTRLNPDINVEVTEEVSSKLEKLLLDDKLDACVINGPEMNEKLEYKDLNSENLILVVPRNSKVAKDNYDFKDEKYINDFIDIKTLEIEKFILLKEDYRLGAISRAIFKIHGINPRNITYVSNLSSALSMASVGLGLTFIPESGVDRQQKNLETPLYFSIGTPNFSFPLIIAYKPEKYKNSIKKFVDFVNDNYKGYGL